MIDPAINNFAAANAHPDLSTARKVLLIPIVASPVGSEKVITFARNLDQQLSIGLGVVAKMTFCVSEYVGGFGFINREVRH